jgi:hypothetical protein
MIVESKQATKYVTKIPPKIIQNVPTLTPARKGDFGSDSASSSLDLSSMASCVLPMVLAVDFLLDLTWLDARDPSFARLYRRGPRSMAVS